MGAKLLHTLACLALSSTPLWGQFFLDFYSQGTLAWRFLRSSAAELHALPTVGVGIASRPRPFFAFGLDVTLSGMQIRTAEQTQYAVWGEFHYRLLLHVRYRQRAEVTPSLGLEWSIPFGLVGSQGWRGQVVHDLRSVRFGTFAGLSAPLPGRRRYIHLFLGGQWFLRSPGALSGAFLPEVRLVWESP
ncbi:hypothetical protein HRbin21_00269 [bacterium HR21]|nr:hypothetical protein HRbin21_00269 [bacterium HR21]